MDIPIPHVSLPEQQAPPSVVLATPTPAVPVAVESHPAEVYSLFEARDEAQVVDALKGRFLAEFIYEYCRRHKWVDGRRPADCHCSDVIVGLSWVGVQEAAREYKGIQVPVEKMRKVETEDFVEVSVEAIDTKTGSSRIGIARQNKKMRLRTGQVMDDEFCTAKAVAKAQRNAIRPLIPVVLIKAWIETHRTTKVNGNGQSALPPAVPKLAITAETVSAAKPNGNGNGANPAVPALPPPAQPANGGSNSNGNGKPAVKGYPSSGQVKRIFGIAYGHKVAKEETRALIKRICGVHDPAEIPTRELYERLCTELGKYNDGVPF